MRASSGQAHRCLRADNSNKFCRTCIPASADRSGDPGILKYVILARQQGDSLEEGIATALEAVLVSPNFLFRIERDRPAATAAAFGSRQRLRTRFEAFLFSLEQYAGCGTAAAAGERRLKQPTVLVRRCGACSATRNRPRFGREFCRTMAAI